MKIVYPTCCGVDVHKTFLVATIIKTAKGLQPSYQKKRFSTFNSDIRRFRQWLYERIAKRRGKKRAIIAIARMILTAVYQMLSTGETWNPCDLYKTDMPQGMQDKQKAKAVKQAIKLLMSEVIISP